MKLYIWPFTNQWSFDREESRHRQEMAIVTPVTVSDRQPEDWPGFLAVEHLDEDLKPTGILNFLLPEHLYTVEGYPIRRSEARKLLEEANKPSLPPQLCEI